jgi:SAM-dependent methyltransferase
MSDRDQNPAGPRYTHGHEPSTLASHGARTAVSSAAYLLPVLLPGMSVLDVGCGPGTITLDLAEVVAPGRVVGIENVEPPLDLARAAAAERGDTTTAFQVADALELPYDDNTFDVVHARTRSSSTSPTRCAHCARCIACVARVAGWLRVMPTTPPCLVSRGPGDRGVALDVPGDRPGERRTARRRSATQGLGPGSCTAA